MLKYYVNVVIQIRREQWNGMQPLYDLTFDHMITRQIKKMSQLLQRLQSPNVVGKDMRIKWYHGYKSRDYTSHITWSSNLLKLHSATFTKTRTSNLGGNTYQKEMVVYLHVTWPNHTKVIKATVPNVASVKGTLSINHMIFHYMISWQMKRACSNFYKSS